MVELHKPIASQLMTMTLMTTAIVPIVLLLAAGALMRRKMLTDPGFWSGLEWLSYRVFTPALFITSIVGAGLSVVVVGPLLLSLSVPIIAVASFVIVLRRPLRANGPQPSSLVQGSIRINTYIGLVFTAAWHGQEGIATFALSSTIAVPLVNVICVSTLAAYGDKAATARRLPVWREFLENCDVSRHR